MFSWIYWVLYQILSLFFTIIGFPVVAVLATLRAWKLRPSKSPMFPGHAVWAWRGSWLTFIWGNEEDGIAGPGIIPTPYAAWHWSAYRNSANNMRLVPGASVTLTGPVTVKLRPWGSVITYGWRSCVIYSRGLNTYRFGWMLSPEANTGYRSWPVLEKL